MQSEVERVRRRAFRFSELGAAESFAYGEVKSQAVTLGYSGRFWVVSMSDAQRLERAGFEWA